MRIVTGLTRDFSTCKRSMAMTELSCNIRQSLAVYADFPNHPQSTEVPDCAEELRSRFVEPVAAVGRQQSHLPTFVWQHIVLPEIAGSDVEQERSLRGEFLPSRDVGTDRREL